MYTPDNTEKITLGWFPKYKPTHIRPCQFTSVFQALGSQGQEGAILSEFFTFLT